MHYGTQAQKDFWLPGLANGKEVPCFALTGPEAGSDAGAIPDKDRLQGMHKGEEVLGIASTGTSATSPWRRVPPCWGWRSSSMTRKLLGDKEEIGITCALIPTSHPGVRVGDRHYPMGLAF
jgi:alkylation response protein AidB-like acyl-CoA dehydrogenase